jgi:hypothetical protein
MLEFANGRIDFPTRVDFGPQQEDQTHSFTTAVRTFSVILTGYELKYDSDDHHFKIGTINVEGALVDPTTISVNCTLGLRDKSDFDDSYSGFVAYAVVADTEA